VDFNLSEEQEALQAMARDFLRERWPTERTRDLLEKKLVVIDDAVWSEIVEMGWLGVAASEEAGGIGGDIMTAAVLAQEAGRGVLPGPFQSSLVAAIALERSGDEELLSKLLPDLMTGATRVTVAIQEPSGLYGPAALDTVAVEREGGWRLSGTKILVPDADCAEVFLVSARTPSGPGLLRIAADAPGVTRNPMHRMDSQSCAEVVLSDVRIGPDALLGGSARGEALLREVYDVWTVLLAADLLGSAEASLELTQQYAIERVQFGRDRSQPAVRRLSRPGRGARECRGAGVRRQSVVERHCRGSRRDGAADSRRGRVLLGVRRASARAPGALQRRTARRCGLPSRSRGDVHGRIVGPARQGLSCADSSSAPVGRSARGRPR
jgi:acyl-CoA dehydrogenase